MSPRWIGVDVGGKRKGFDVAVIDDHQLLALQNRLKCQQVVDLVTTYQPAVVAIDSPRSCAPEGQTAREGERQLAKTICGIRWTPDVQHVHANLWVPKTCATWADGLVPRSGAGRAGLGLSGDGMIFGLWA